MDPGPDRESLIFSTVADDDDALDLGQCPQAGRLLSQ